MISMFYRAKTQLPLQYRQAAFGANSARDDGTVDLTWTTGAGVMRYDWRSSSEYMETLSVKAGHVHLEQLNAGAPVLDTHSNWTSLDVRGVVVKAWLEDGGIGAATVRFDLQDEKAAALFRKVKEGFVKGVSVGYEVHEYEEIFIEGKLTERLAISWTPREISICPMGADHGGQIRDAKPDKNKLIPCKLSRRSAPKQPTAPKGNTPMKNFKRGAITSAKAKELAKKWITLVAGDEALTAELALEISSFMNGEEAGEAAGAAEPEGEMSAVEEAAREVVNMDKRAPESKVVAALYRLEMRAARTNSATQGVNEEQARARTAKLDGAVREGKLTPAERKLVERRLVEGKLTDQDLDEELAIAPKVGPGTTPIEPPAPQDPANPAAVRAATPAATPGAEPWKTIINQDMRDYCEKRGRDVNLFAQSWFEANPGRPYTKPSDRKN